MDKVHAKAQGSQPGHALKPVLGPLTMRDALVVVGGVLVLVGSLVPIPWTKSVAVNMWIFPGLPFHLFVSLLLPLGIAAAFLWRRLTGRTRVRVASLSLDQAGSVVGLFAAAYFFNSYVASMSPAYLLGLLGALAMVAGTTLATYLGVFRRDFVSGGDSVLAADVHPVALAAKKPAAQAAASDSESGSDGFGASSAASAGAGSASAGRPATPVTGKPEGRGETSSASAPATGTPAARATAGAAAGVAATGVAAAAATDAASDKKSPAHDSSAAAQRRESAVNASNGSEAKAAEQAAPAAANTAAPGAGEADAPAAKDAQQAGNASAGNPDETDAAHPLTEWKSVAEAKDAPETESGTESGTESAAEPRTAADAADADATHSATAANARETSSGSTDAQTAKPADASRQEDAAKPEANRAATPAAAATSGKESRAEAPKAEHADATATDAEAQDPAHPATMATPRAGTDIKATAALSRADIAAHQAAVERAKAESESSFGAKAEVHAHDGHEEEAASFWFALNHPRPVFHPVNGTMLSTLNPGAWILCLEDRGTEYLVNLADGRPAVLRNLDDLQFPDK
ncbi:hypothetical protein ACIPVK_20170 [Paeniglutamicibacter sp. MACA_103]|uniref:hypothetical protein n=1 Tax=Paeniglutamicibacter sp. MACA_103 TaxID=3377337 RepID=UPI003892D045